jgi:hypothetical protein
LGGDLQWLVNNTGMQNIFVLDVNGIKTKMRICVKTGKSQIFHTEMLRKICTHMALKMIHFEIIPFENIVINSFHHLLRITNLLLENLREFKNHGILRSTCKV